MEDEVIFNYTIEQAIEDGVLIQPYANRWPWLCITPAIHHACTKDTNRSYDQCLVPLLIDCIRQAQSNQNERQWELEGTIAGYIWIMVNEKGGLTVMTPDEY